MFIGFHRERLEAALIQMAAADVLVMGVPALRVGQRQPVHEIGEFAIAFGPKDEVPVVGHQAVRKESHAGHVPLRLGKDLKEGFVVARLVKNRQSAIAPVKDMVDNAAQRGSQGSSHGVECNRRGGERQGEKGPDTFFCSLVLEFLALHQDLQ